MRAWFATATDPLRREQPVGTQQPEHSFAAGVDLVFAAQPGPDLAIALPGEG
jgi:hypothetical protein